MPVLIPNHYSHPLSELDLEMVRAVPPGGNWKNIPVSIPSKRLQQIRESYAAGKGSRSTYYGRLHPDKPSYTINTYFNRPGNGSFIHYDYEGGQHRLISQREAARLQSFPDSFVFYGNRASINKQIGNAVPPLVAFQIARALGQSGVAIDLFCGAGGLSLGFMWANWTPLVATDIDASFLTTYARNLHDNVVPGDLRNPKVFEEVVSRTRRRLPREGSVPFFVLGGPPCQGFSTAGNRRSLEDSRNTLFKEYRKVLSVLQPDGFVFENVPGIVNMAKGRVFEMVQEELSSEGHQTHIWRLRSEHYGVPQRRTRVFLVGVRRGSVAPSPPQPVTSFSSSQSLFHFLPPVFSVREALDDLPPLKPGQDGSALGYRLAPESLYQRFARGDIARADLIGKLKGSG